MFLTCQVFVCSVSGKGQGMHKKQQGGVQGQGHDRTLAFYTNFSDLEQKRRFQYP